MKWTEDSKKRKELAKKLSDYGTGQSSEAILKTFYGEIDYFFDTPCDSSDLMRCIIVVEIFGIDVNIMKEKGKTWNHILKNWENLCKLSKDIKKNKIQINEILNEAKRI